MKIHKNISKQSKCVVIRHICCGRCYCKQNKYYITNFGRNNNGNNVDLVSVIKKTNLIQLIFDIYYYYAFGEM